VDLVALFGQVEGKQFTDIGVVVNDENCVGQRSTAELGLSDLYHLMRLC